MSRYRTLFALPGAASFLWRTLLGRLPLGMLSLAVLLFVREQTGSFGTAGLAVGATVLGQAAFAPVKGTLVDRFGPTPVVASCAVAQSGLLLLLLASDAVGAGAPVLVAISALIGIVVPPISAASRAIWPRLAPDEATREALFALDAASQELIWTCGPLLVALGTLLGGPAAAIVLTAGITLLGGLLFASSSVARAPRGAVVARDGRALTSRGLRRLLPSVFVMGVGLGHLELALPAIAVDVGSSAAAGALLAAWAFGSLVGGVYYGTRSWGSSARRRHVVLLALLALAVAPLALTGDIATALPLGALAGLFIAPAFSCQFVIVESETPEGATAEAFSWYTTALVGGISAGTVAAGQLIEAIGAHQTILCAVAVLLLAALTALRVPAGTTSERTDAIVEQEACRC